MHGLQSSRVKHNESHWVQVAANTILVRSETLRTRSMLLQDVPDTHKEDQDNGSLNTDLTMAIEVTFAQTWREELEVSFRDSQLSWR
nr:hypothetical protein [Tanacetum cinerariifolium]